MNFFESVKCYTQQRNQDMVRSTIQGLQSFPMGLPSHEYNYIMNLSKEDYLWLTEQHFLMFNHESQYSLNIFHYATLLKDLSDEEVLEIAYALYQKYPNACSALGPLLLTIPLTLESYEQYHSMFLAASRYIPSYLMMHPQMLKWKDDPIMIRYSLESLWHHLDRYPQELIAVFTGFYGLKQNPQLHKPIAILAGYCLPKENNEHIFLELYNIDPSAARSFWDEQNMTIEHKECEVHV